MNLLEELGVGLIRKNYHDTMSKTIRPPTPTTVW